MVDPESKRLWNDLRQAIGVSAQSNAQVDSHGELVAPCCKLMRRMGRMLTITIQGSVLPLFNNFCPQCGAELKWPEE